MLNKRIFLLLGVAIALLFSTIAYAQDSSGETDQPPGDTAQPTTDTDHPSDTSQPSSDAGQPPDNPQPTANGGNVPAPVGFTPKWQVGDTWTIEAAYRDLKADNSPWLPPIQWIFKVKSIKNLMRTDCYALHIYPKDPSLRMQAVVYLAVKDLRPIRVIDIYPSKDGSVKNKQKDYDPFNAEPLLSEDSIIPYDLPTFPLTVKNVQEADSNSASAYSQSQNSTKKLKSTSKVGPFSFKKAVYQTGKAPEKQYADALLVYRNGTQAYQVEINDSRASGGPLVQIWQGGSPWAITCQNWGKRVKLISKSLNTTRPLNYRGGNR
ncbi:MAG: hypothetical protein HQM08_01075 [Candidatus Riflebacteria bacterium]|nr:hypothetical protein [Candidatus Riflebacteria bacterium]